MCDENKWNHVFFFENCNCRVFAFEYSMLRSFAKIFIFPIYSLLYKQKGWQFNWRAFLNWFCIAAWHMKFSATLLIFHADCVNVDTTERAFHWIFDWVPWHHKSIFFPKTFLLCHSLLSCMQGIFFNAKGIKYSQHMAEEFQQHELSHQEKYYMKADRR